MATGALAGQTITRAEIHLPLYGSWWADVETDSGEALSGAGSIVLAGLTLAGEVERGGVSAGAGRYLVRGGLAWERHVPARPYQSDAGVRLRTVLLDLARDALGRAEAARVVLPPDRVLGTAYSRPGGRARVLLSRLWSRWYVAPDGSTRLEERTGEAPTAAAQVLRRNLAHGLRVIGTEAPEAFLPGITFEGERVRASVIRVGSGDYTIELWSADR